LRRAATLPLNSCVGPQAKSMTDSPPNSAKLDATVAAPDHHAVLVENPRVRVLDTRLAPWERTPVHKHQWPAALYVLSRSDFIRYSPGDGIPPDSRSLPSPPAIVEPFGQVRCRHITSTISAVLICTSSRLG
jgi:hypothetical protein